mgnify:CR=1 FL=1
MAEERNYTVGFYRLKKHTHMAFPYLLRAYYPWRGGRATFLSLVSLTVTGKVMPGEGCTFRQNFRKAVSALYGGLP